MNIKLTKNMFAVVDPEDFERVNSFKWFYNGGYAVRWKGGRRNRIKIYLHRFIFGDFCSECVDHINGDKLDNRRSNLRPASRCENSRNQKLRKDNSTGFKGVRKHQTGKFRAGIKCLGKEIHLGLFSTPEMAHLAYAKASKQFHGEFGRVQ